MLKRLRNRSAKCCVLKWSLRKTPGKTNGGALSDTIGKRLAPCDLLSSLHYSSRTCLIFTSPPAPLQLERRALLPGYMGVCQTKRIVLVFQLCHERELPLPRRGMPVPIIGRMGQFAVGYSRKSNFEYRTPNIEC